MSSEPNPSGRELVGRILDLVSDRLIEKDGTFNRTGHDTLIEGADDRAVELLAGWCASRDYPKVRAIRECGAEHQANPGSSLRDALDDAASFFRKGVTSYAELTASEGKACSEHFWAGAAEERKLQNQG